MSTSPLSAVAIILMCSCSASAAIAAQPSAAAWEYSDTVDPVTDAKRAVATLGNDELGAVMFKCDKNGPGSVYVLALPPGAYVGPSSGDRPVTMRFDDGAAEDDNWHHSSQYVMKMSRSAIEAVFNGPPSWDMGVSVDALATRMATARKIVLRIRDFRQVPFDLVLSSDGDGSAIRRVYDTCGDAWPPAKPN